MSGGAAKARGDMRKRIRADEEPVMDELEEMEEDGVSSRSR